MSGRSAALDTSVAHPARRYNYWLGGKDNFAADRQSGDQIAAAFPDIVTAVQENRRFLRRVVTYLATECGIRQFLDIGTGLPTADNTHEVAQRIAPQARIVYVDNDPLVLAHARALLTSHRDGATAYIDADLRRPDDILAAPELHATLDLTQPVGLLLIAILHFIADYDNPHAIVARLMDAIPAGSYLALSHGTFDVLSEATIAQLTDADDASPTPFQPRSHTEVTRFLGGMKTVDPGVVSIADWRADHEPVPRPALQQVATYGAVAHRP
jgi:hypothetical protein